MFSRRKIAAFTAEFLGTGILAFVVLTVSRSQIGIPYFVAIAAGLAVMLFGLALGRDMQLNPAYTFALWLNRRVSSVKAVVFIAAQMLGGMAAYTLYKFFAQNGVIQPLPSEYEATILVAEAFGAFVFAFAASGALFRQAHPLVRSVVTGGGYAVGVMVASVAAAGFINPAVAIASNAWVWSTYVLGPVVGAFIGVTLNNVLFGGRNKASVVAATTTTSSPVVATGSKSTLNEDAIEVSPANVADKPLAKVAKAEKSAQADKKNDKKAKAKKSKK